MIILEALQSILSILVMIAIGYILTRKGWFNEETGEAFSKLVINVSMPALLVYNLMSTFDKKSLGAIIGGVAIPFSSIFISYLLAIAIGYLIKVKEGRRGTFQAMFILSNTLFMGMPINIALFGEKSTPYVLLYYIANTTFLWTLGIYLIQRDTSKGQLKIFSLETLKRIFTPPLIAFALAVALILLGIKLPKFVMDTTKYLGNLTTPISLLFIGITFYGIKLRDIRISKDMIGIMFGRFVASPAIVILLSYLWGAPWIMKAVFTIQSAMPTITQAAIVTKAYDADYEYATVMVTTTTVASIIIIPIFRAILG